jgi:hypothetical protein
VLGSSSETHLATAASSPGPAILLAEARWHRASVAPPMEFSTVQRSRCDESAGSARAAGEVPPPSVPSLSAFLTPSGTWSSSTVLPCSRMNSGRQLTLVGFITLQSFVPPEKLSRLVTESCPPRRFSGRTAVPLPVVPDCGRRVPEGLSLPGSVHRILGHLQVERGGGLSWSFCVFVVLPAPVSGVATLPSLVFHTSTRACAHRWVGPPTSLHRCRGVARRSERRPPWRFGPSPRCRRPEGHRVSSECRP